MKDQVTENFVEKAMILFKNSMDNFTKRSAALIINGSGWGENVIMHERELELQLRTIIKNAREKEIDKLQLLM